MSPRCATAALVLLLAVQHAQAQETRSAAPQPARPVCVLDPSAPAGLRLDSLVHSRIPPADSVVTRTGARRWLSDLTPTVLGYAAPPRGLKPDTAYTIGGSASVEWVMILGHRYGRFGPPRAIRPSLITWIGEVQGVSIFIEPGADLGHDPETLYVLVEPTCEFLPYASPEGMQ